MENHKNNTVIQDLDDYKKRVLDKNYTKHIELKLDAKNNILIADDLNQFIIFLNTGFYLKNNFFVDNLNKKKIREIYLVSNKLKAQILKNTKEKDILFDDISKSDLLCLRYIINNFVNNFDKKIANDTVLCYIFSKQSLKNIGIYLKTKIDLLTEE